MCLFYLFYWFDDIIILLINTPHQFKTMHPHTNHYIEKDGVKYVIDLTYSDISLYRWISEDNLKLFTKKYTGELYPSNTNA